MACDLIDKFVVVCEWANGGMTLRDVKTRQEVVLTPAGVDRLREHLTPAPAREAGEESDK